MGYKDTCTECQGKGCFECGNTGEEWIEDIHEDEDENI